MFKMKRTLGIIVLAATLILASCSEDKSKNNDDIKANNVAEESVPAISETQEVELAEEPETAEDEIEQEEVQEEPEPEFPFTNPLTGEGTETDLTTIRPISVMVNNIKQSLPQIGVSEADVVYEILEEGGITRLLCVYNNYSDIPEIGSIRSARDYYIDIADAHDAIFVHAGGSTYAYTALANRGTDDIDGLYVSQFYRSAERRKTMSTEHTLMISGSGLDEAIAYKGFRTTSQAQSPLTFGDDYKTGEAPAEHISIPFVLSAKQKPYITSYFDYGSTSGMYHKGHFGEAHIDGDDGEQLTFKNVITLTCSMNIIKGDPLGCIQVHFTGTGKGTYNVDGTSREIVWKKDSRSAPYTLYESDGETPLVVAPGKSYIALVSPNATLTIK